MKIGEVMDIRVSKKSSYFNSFGLKYPINSKVVLAQSGRIIVPME